MVVVGERKGTMGKVEVARVKALMVTFTATSVQVIHVRGGGVATNQET